MNRLWIKISTPCWQLRISSDEIPSVIPVAITSIAGVQYRIAAAPGVLPYAGDDRRRREQPALNLTGPPFGQKRQKRDRLRRNRRRRESRDQTKHESLFGASVWTEQALDAVAIWAGGYEGTVSDDLTVVTLTATIPWIGNDPGTAHPDRFRQVKRSGAKFQSGTVIHVSGDSACDERALSAPRGRNVVALRRTGVDLAGPPDPLLRIFHHLLPLADPAHGARNREQRGEHARGKAHGLQDDARIEIDIRVELPVHEIPVVQRDLFQLDRQIEQRVSLDTQFRQHIVAGFLDDLRARIVVLVDPVAEAHQLRVVSLVLHVGQEIRNVFDVADVGEHFQHRLIRAAVGR